MSTDGTEKTWEDSNYTYNEADVWQSADGQKAYANAADYNADKPITDAQGYTDPDYTETTDDEFDVDSDLDGL
ncbi:hypothetical protein [Streptomyces cavernae]|uniref:hypothetical protein n=1 Tax=Streptomyces cavernae TaxID=2259034 RepID=UPI000FEC1E3E|nr:hypothetical protein [Streptomyces cavernae]